MHTLSDPSLAGTAATSIASGASPSRVIVVDDDDGVRTLLVHFLRKRGYDVVGFADGKAAIAWVRDNRCALVITDIMMRETDGLEVIRYLRRTDPKLKIIAVSGGDSRGNSYLNAARVLGAANVVAKPFSLTDLDAIVRQVFCPA